MNEVAPIAAPSTTLIDLLRAAVDKGADVATLERLAKLYEAAEANEQKKAFDNAFAAVKAELRPIIKDQEVQKSSGGRLYGYETFAAIAEVVDPILAKHGMFYRFPDGAITEKREPNKIYVTCRLSHRGGYSEDTTRDAPPDVGQNRNAVQAMGSTITYLQRYTLKAALGLAVSQDRDGGKKRFADRPENIATPQPDPDHIIESDKPEPIRVRDGMQWQDWSKALLMMINASPTAELVELWLQKNKEQLGELLLAIPGHHQFVVREANKRIRKLRGSNAA